MKAFICFFLTAAVVSVFADTYALRAEDCYESDYADWNMGSSEEWSIQVSCRPWKYSITASDVSYSPTYFHNQFSLLWITEMISLEVSLNSDA